MRIIAGQWRGRKLTSPAGDSTRPTADRVRETLFSMLASRIGSFDDLRVADLYAGSGAFGLEALSRGASFACFVERDHAALTTVRSNIASLGAEGLAQVRPAAVEKVQADQPFDIVFADPPYATGSGTTALAHINAGGWAAEGGWIAIETKRGDAVDPQGFTLATERDLARSRITLLCLRGRPSSPS